MLLILLVDVATVDAACGQDFTIENEYTLAYQGSGQCTWNFVAPAGFTIEYICSRVVIPSGAGCNPNFATINGGARRCTSIAKGKTASNTLKFFLNVPTTTANLLCKFTPVANPCDCGNRLGVSKRRSFLHTDFNKFNISFRRGS